MTDDLDLGQFESIGDPFAGAAGTPVEPLRPATAAALARPSPARGRVRAVRVAAVGCAVLLEAGWVALHGLRRDMPVQPGGAIAIELAIPLIAAGLALGAATARGARGLGLTATRIVAAALGVPAFFALATVLTAAPDVDDGHFWSHTLLCMCASFVLAAVPFALIVGAFRRSFVAAAGWRTATLGVAAGGIAAATLSVTCTVGTMGHIVLGHGIVFLMAALAGGAVARTRFIRG